MTTATMLAACLMLSAQTFHVPPSVMIGIMQVEGGRVGQEVADANGTYDLGPMQINTIWLPELARYWGVDQRTARTWVRDNGCVNMHVAAWILRRQLDRTSDLRTAIAWYHSATPGVGDRYAAKVVQAMIEKKLIDFGPKANGVASSGSYSATLPAPQPAQQKLAER